MKEGWNFPKLTIDPNHSDGTPKTRTECEIEMGSMRQRLAIIFETADGNMTELKKRFPTLFFITMVHKPYTHISVTVRRKDNPTEHVIIEDELLHFPTDEFITKLMLIA